jgi:hypothetical protein
MGSPSSPTRGRSRAAITFPTTSLWRVGILAFSIESGTEFVGKPADYGTRLFEEFNWKH